MTLPARAYVLLVTALVCVTTGDLLTKSWTRGGGTTTLVAAWVCYVVVSGIWFLVIRERPELGRVGTVWTVCGVMGSLSVGLIYGETLSPVNKLGVLLCIIGVIMTST